MCVSCGCGQVNQRHKDGDLTMDDIQRAARNHDLQPNQVAQNIQKSVSQQGGSMGRSM